ncbi:MAG: DUF59 domain-containing protein [Alphaproteobacteria bacterium]|nr:DUF59 domain-containing protein [Alphaproteobacteria bacterium]
MEEITDIDWETTPKDYTAHSGAPLVANTPIAKREAIIAALKTVSDPEITINIWDMGLVYKLEQKDNGDVYIEMTVTSPMCPVAEILPEQAAKAVAQVEGTGEVEVKVVWEPAWDISMLSEDAKAMIELF